MSDFENTTRADDDKLADDVNQQIAKFNQAIDQVGQQQTDLQLQFEAGLIDDHYKNPRMEALSMMEARLIRERDTLMNEIDGVQSVKRPSLWGRFGNYIVGRSGH